MKFEKFLDKKVTMLDAIGIKYAGEIIQISKEKIILKSKKENEISFNQQDVFNMEEDFKC